MRLSWSFSLCFSVRLEVKLEIELAIAIALALALALHVGLRAAVDPVRGVAPQRNRSEYNVKQLEMEKRSRCEKSKRGNEMGDLTIVRTRRRRSSLELVRAPVLGVSLEVETVGGIEPLRGLTLQPNRSE